MRRWILFSAVAILVVVAVGLIPVTYKHVQGAMMCTARAPLAMHLVGEITGDYDGVPLNLYYSDECRGFDE